MVRKRKTGKKILIAFFVVAAILAAAYFGFQLFSIGGFTSNPVSMTQYVGSTSFESWSRPDILHSDTASFFGYEIRTYKTAWECEYSEPYCGTNTCGGSQTGTDEHGCPLYQKTESFTVWKDCKASASLMYKCDCRYGDRARCLDPVHPTYPGWKTGSESKTVSCGGQKVDNLGCSWGCWTKHEIRRDGEVLYSEATYSRDAGQLTFPIDDRQLLISFNYDSGKQRYDQCDYVVNTFRFDIPSDAFNFTVYMPESAVVQGDQIDVRIEIMNKWAPVTAYLETRYEIPTILSNPSTETKTETFDLPVGVTSVGSSLPATLVTDRLKVTPTLYVLVPGSSFGGVNGRCFGQESSEVTGFNNCEYVELGSVSADPKEVRIVSEIPSYCLDAGITTVSECDAYVSENIALLNLNVEEKAALIKSMTDKLEEMGMIVSDLNLSLQDTAALIESMEVKISELSEVLEGMNNTVQHNIAIMEQMELTIADQVSQIERLSRTQAEKDEYIASLLSSIKGQDGLIAQLEAETELQASQIVR